MLISDKQHQANRQNTQHSTGPTSPAGKAAIRFNALTYGLRTRASILPDENAADYSQLWDELEADWQPQTRTERCYPETIVTSQWCSSGWPRANCASTRASHSANTTRATGAAFPHRHRGHEAVAESAAGPPVATRETRADAGSQARRTARSPPDYVMSEGTQARPISCAPGAPDSR